MSTSDKFKTYDEMVTGTEFIQSLETLRSGSQAAATGINRALERLARNSDALLDAHQATKWTFLSGGGNVSWVGGTSTLSWTADIVIRFAHEIAGAVSNTISAGSINSLSSSNSVAWVKLDRTSNATVTVNSSTDFAGFLTAIAGDVENRLDYFVIAIRDNGNDLILWDGRRIRTGETITNSGYTDTQYAQESEYSVTKVNQLSNYATFLTGGGFVEWDGAAMTITNDLTIMSPGHNGANTITAFSGTAIAAGEYMHCQLDRASAATIAVGVSATPPMDADRFIVAHHDALDGRLYLWDGTALDPGQRFKLGSAVTGVEWIYQQPGDGGQETDISVSVLNSPPLYEVAAGDLHVFVNGTRAMTKAGVYWKGDPGSGAMVGTLETWMDYVEVMDTDDGTPTGVEEGGSRIYWVVFDVADLEAGFSTLHHAGAPATAYHQFGANGRPNSTDRVEAFIALQGEAAGPVESVGIYPEPGGGPLTGAVKIEAGTNVTVVYDSGNNSIVVSVSGAIGVTSLEGLTGVLTIPSSTLSVTPSGSTITIDLDADLSDLNNMTTDIEDAIANALAPDVDNRFATWADLGFMQGFDTCWSDSTTGVKASPGVVFLGGQPYVAAGEISCDVTTQWVGSESFIGQGWHYLYLAPHATTIGDEPQLLISYNPPDSTGEHPTEADHKFLCSCRLGSGGSIQYGFWKIGTRVVLTSNANLGLTSEWNAVNSSTYTSVAIGDYAPESAVVLEAFLSVEITRSVGAGSGYGSVSLRHTTFSSNIQNLQHPIHYGSNTTRSELMQVDLVPDSGNGHEFLIDGTYITAIYSAQMRAYHEPRYGAGGAWRI